MTQERRNSINNLADLVRDRYSLGPTVDLEAVEQLVNNLGGKVRRESLEFYTDGNIRREEGGYSQFIITLNQENFASPSREKFTLAHELGHLFIHMGFCTDNERWEHEVLFEDTVYNRRGYSEEEYEANEFAAALLMPRQEYRSQVDLYTTDGKCDVSSIAGYFGVSYEAALNRGRWLGLIAWT